MSSSALRSFGHVVLWLAVSAFVVFAFVRWGPDSLSAYSSLLTVLLGLTPYQDRIKKFFAGRSIRSTQEQLDAAALQLRDQVTRQYRKEAGERHLVHAADVMAVPWEPVGRNGPDAAPTVAALIEDFAAAPRRLVVVGGPGSGKSAFCLMAANRLLEDPMNGGGRIPIVFELSAWRADAGKIPEFGRWLERRLSEEHRFLADPEYGTHTADSLLSESRLVVILDGLDELPTDLAKRVLKHLREDPAFHHDYILACRDPEIWAVLDGASLPGAAMVRLKPLAGDSAAAHIEACFADNADSLARWVHIGAAITEAANPALAETLTNPFMLSLAIDAYTSSSRNPAELLDIARFPDSAAIQRHLLDHAMRGAYGPRSDHGGRDRPKVDWDREAALGWHRNIARHLSSLGSTELSWWELNRHVPRRVLLLTPIIAGALACLPLGALIFWQFGKPGFGVLFGLAAGLCGGATVGSLPVEAPRRFSFKAIRPRELRRPGAMVRTSRYALVGVFVGGLLAGLLYSAAAGLFAALVFGAVFGAARLATSPTVPKEAVTPSTSMAADRRAVLLGAAMGAVAGVVVGGGIALTDSPRTHLILHLSTAGQGLLGAANGALLGGAGLGLMLYATSAWGNLTTVRWWLALHHWTPLRLMTFLDDARRVDIFRIAGPRYQYRHLLLQEHLAEEREEV
ncbi:NACHT domain-containing protein [Catenulispora rubra]|uniref:NACHT domain-containing protein n=1 Tax=Catenulispora rubra TaxID=280293 RepID=UPI0018926988|nr:hypothetical protein [Catenulispora rubra]